MYLEIQATQHYEAVQMILHLTLHNGCTVLYSQYTVHRKIELKHALPSHTHQAISSHTTRRTPSQIRTSTKVVCTINNPPVLGQVLYDKPEASTTVPYHTIPYPTHPKRYNVLYDHLCRSQNYLKKSSGIIPKYFRNENFPS